MQLSPISSDDQKTLALLFEPVHDIYQLRRYGLNAGCFFCENVLPQQELSSASDTRIFDIPLTKANGLAGIDGLLNHTEEAIDSMPQLVVEFKQIVLPTCMLRRSAFPRHQC